MQFIMLQMVWHMAIWNGHPERWWPLIVNKISVILIAVTLTSYTTNCGWLQKTDFLNVVIFCDFKCCGLYHNWMYQIWKTKWSVHICGMITEEREDTKSLQCCHVYGRLKLTRDHGKIDHGSIRVRLGGENWLHTIVKWFNWPDTVSSIPGDSMIFTSKQRPSSQTKQ